ncbi:RHS repeat domain-containing protein [Dyadobacter sp. NIV53]|uniref:RHS repeat domain-containing protein n=1 Tax=Dyadobacter sp. NIV53 TaxID=2861765 RepID=UPI001C87F499|nr:RHS repeat-associated core domain-containing protein [Dyadobacter sp. NIV53]
MALKYEGPFNYRISGSTNVLDRVQLSEGQAVYRNGLIKIEYYLKDYQGNSKTAFDETGTIVQKTDYYPFSQEIPKDVGVPLNARNGINCYNFLGKETQVASVYIDLQARFYDPLTGRFTSVDPVTKSQEQLSIYQYGWNNPIRYSDPNGDCPICDDFKKLFNATNNYLTKNVSGYVKSSVEVTAGQRVALKIGEGVGGDMNAASVRLVKAEASYDTGLATFKWTLS